jgi:ATP10 protein
MISLKLKIDPMKATLTTACLLCLLICHAQVGKIFPLMEAETLTEQPVILPKDLGGKHTIIALAFSKKSEEDLTTWFSPAYNQFMRKPDKTNVFATEYDINLYFVPMFTGHKTVAYKSVMEKVQGTVDKQLHPHILFYKGSLDTYKKELNFQGKEVPYFYLLDDTGKIVWFTSGEYTDAKMQEVVDKLDEVLGGW